VSSTPATDVGGRTHRSPLRAALLELAVAVPGAVLLAIAVAHLAGVALGHDRMWPTETLTLSEAAALRDEAEVLLLIGRGADPNAPGVVRRDFLRGTEDVLTPLEAAVGARREQMIELLLQLGATLDAPTWTRLTCFAERHDAPAAGRVLAAHRPDGADADCEGVATPW